MPSIDEMFGLDEDGNSIINIENIENEDVADAFTKGSLVDLPQLSVMRETEFLTDFLKNSSKDTCERYPI